MDFGDMHLFFGLEDVGHIARVVARLAAALALGAVIGLERLRAGKAAGVRTHALVAIGAAVFVLVPLESGVQPDDLTRVMQGIVAGIGFLGAGAILKSPEDQRIAGLTTAASIWLTASVGMAIGAGWMVPALAAVVLGWCLLRVGNALERTLTGKDE